MFYVPSMRNGKQSGAAAEDRGNAILSSLSLEGLEAIELPFSVQRRVAVAASVHDRESAHRFRIMTVHLDTRAPLSQGFIFGAPAARSRQAKWVAEAVAGPSAEGLSLIVGGDLNNLWGALESSADTFAKVVPRVDCGGNATHKFGFTLDHMFARFTSTLVPVSCRRPDNRFGSDHYPLILSLRPA
jgi:endonuclease/exonuclease/phosphatase family metal-dependent hydrolase